MPWRSLELLVFSILYYAAIAAISSEERWVMQSLKGDAAASQCESVYVQKLYRAAAATAEEKEL